MAAPAILLLLQAISASRVNLELAREVAVATPGGNLAVWRIDVGDDGGMEVVTRITARPQSGLSPLPAITGCGNTRLPALPTLPCGGIDLSFVRLLPAQSFPLVLPPALRPLVVFAMGVDLVPSLSTTDGEAIVAPCSRRRARPRRRTPPMPPMLPMPLPARRTRPALT